jgi:biotin-dependent carboxylase-like uncharacterized protein
MKALEIIATGPLAMVQDLGRPGRMKYGVPPGGALDRESLQLANALVGNAPGQPAIEITLGGFSATALCPLTLATAGAWAPLDVDGAPVEPYMAFSVAPGRTINVAPVSWGARVYLAVAGGIDAPSVLGSAATFARGRMGGLTGDGKPLRVGDVISVGAAATATPNSRPALDWAAAALARRAAALAGAATTAPATLRVVLGPQDHLFTSEGVGTFLSSEYEVTPLTDRMGARLDGPVIAHVKGADIVSDGVPDGAVQVPGDGKPIIMLADRQTTGGYTKIACVAAVDLDIAGQLKPGDRVRFEAITVEQARAALAAEQAARTRRSMTLRMSQGGVERLFRVVEIG